MERVNITLAFDSEKVEAMEMFLRKENSSVQRKMDESLRQLYESAVPEAVRQYLDAKSGRPARPRPKPKAANTDKEAEIVEQEHDDPCGSAVV